MKKLLFTVCCIGAMSLVKAQTAEDSVRTAVNNMFTAMKNSDSAALQLCFTDGATLQTISRNKEGGVLVRDEAIAEFVHQVTTLPKGAADERIVFESIKIDGNLANVWTPYNFYYNGSFSHCGVNNFVLVKMNNVWKIHYIIDTRRKQGCKP